MNRRHVLVISLLIGLAALAGLVAASRTAGLGRASRQPTVSPASIDARMRALDRTEASLHRALAQKPVAAPRAPQAQKVIYVRPAPRVVTIHRAHGDGYEAEGGEHEGGFDD